MVKDEHFDFSVSLNRVVLHCLGIWPIHDDDLEYFKFYTSFWSMQIALITSITFSFQVKSPEEFVKSMMFNAMSFMTLMKFLIINFKSETLKLILDHVKDDWQRYDFLLKKNQKVIDRHTTKGKIVSVFCLSMLLLTTFGNYSPAYRKLSISHLFSI